MFAASPGSGDVAVLVLAHERGGRIVTQILDDLVVATTRDLKVLDEIESEGLEMKINAGAVVVMPWLVSVVLTNSRYSYRSEERRSGRYV